MDKSHDMPEKQIWELYYRHTPRILRSMDLCRGEEDFRKVYIADDGKKKLVIKYASNAFTDGERIGGWARLIHEYNKLGIYCPQIVPNKNHELAHHFIRDGRDYYVFAEEFAKYDTAVQRDIPHLKDAWGKPSYIDDVLRSVGKVAAMHFDFLSFPSGYCLLEPYSSSDTADEGTECALLFRDYVKEKLPAYYPQVEKLLELFFINQEALRRVYPSLPVSCFQADLNDSNLLLDSKNQFVGLIDFNLSGKEPVLNYTVRTALWKIHDRRLSDENNGDSKTYWYHKEMDDLRIQLFLQNIRCIEEYYPYSETEREAFPILFRYMNSFWWQHTREIKRIQGNDDKIHRLLAWLEHQMTRDDIRLP